MRITFFFMAALLTASNAFCQKNYFNGFGKDYYAPSKNNGIIANKSSDANAQTTADDAKEQKRDNDCEDAISTEEPTTENLNEANSHARTAKLVAKKKQNGKQSQRLRLYEGEDHPLNMRNLLCVMEEVGVTNQIIVLAQSLLETGFFSSNVCKTHNNLFGLYDSRNKCYYSFERWEDSVVGYRKFIQYRYKSGNYFAFLKRIGYAVDPQYINKVGKITKMLCEEGNIID